MLRSLSDAGRLRESHTVLLLRQNTDYSSYQFFVILKCKQISNNSQGIKIHLASLSQIQSMVHNGHTYQGRQEEIRIFFLTKSWQHSSCKKQVPVSKWYKNALKDLEIGHFLSKNISFNRKCNDSTFMTTVAFIAFTC